MTIQNYVGTSSLDYQIANTLQLCSIKNPVKLSELKKEACEALGLDFGKSGKKTPEWNLAVFEWLRDNKITAINNVLIEAPEPTAMPIPELVNDIEPAPQTELMVVDSMTSIIAEINNQHELAINAANQAVEHAKRAGELLLQVKAELPHGEFGKWLAENVTVSERQAQRYMQKAAGELPAPAPTPAKTDMVSYLKHEKSIKKIQADLSAIDTNNLSPESISEWQSIRDAVNKIKFELDNLLDDDQTPETQKPRDIAINAACESVVKCTPTLALAGAMVANQ